MMVDKARRRMRNLEKKSAEMAAKVEQARRSIASAELNRDANEKAWAEARSHFHKTQQEHFARFPSGCPLDNDVGAGQGAGPAAAAGIKDASGDVVMGEVNGVVIEPPEDGDQETKIPLEAAQRAGEEGAASSRRNGCPGGQAPSLEAAAKTAAELQAAVAKAAGEAAGSQDL